MTVDLRIEGGRGGIYMIQIKSEIQNGSVGGTTY